MIDDAYFRLRDRSSGQPGPDQGKGGKFLLVRSDYKGAVPTEGYYITKTRTYNNLVIIRAFVQDGDLAATVRNVKAATRMYPLRGRGQPSGTEVREHLGHQVQYGPRQRLQVL